MDLRCDALADYLAEIHAVRGDEPGLYVRRIRELLGHGECIMGLADSYPPAWSAIVEDLERRCLEWRFRLKGRVHRLRQVHGDFHPWNILFREGTDFTTLDRSRGEWGEPADDLAAISSNYLFFALQARSKEGRAALFDLFHRFWSRYLRRTGDREIFEVAAPFFAFRGLVLASPLWYPDLDESIREKLFLFMRQILASPRFDPAQVEDLIEQGHAPTRRILAGGSFRRTSKSAREIESSRSFALWITGLPASGKSTLARALRREFARHGVTVEILESDTLRRILTPQAAYDERERDSIYAAMTHMGKLLVEHGVPVLFDATANLRRYRDRARAAVPRFFEVFVHCPIELCEARDPKGLYKRARGGKLDFLPGVQAPYEPPERPDFVVRSDRESPEAASRRILAGLGFGRRVRRPSA
jgi:adenylyl-sulfate kinase